MASFCTKKPVNIPLSQTITQQQAAGPKLCVVQGLPECLKIVSSYRYQLNRDFNSILEEVLADGPKRPLLVFIFSDPQERTKSWLNKIFSQKVLEHPKTGQLVLNPVTDKNISAVLEEIAAKQAIFETHLSKQQLQEIKDTCNKDLRNAIQTLQFFSIGKTMRHQSETMLGKKLAKVSEEGSDRSGKGSHKKSKQEQVV